MQECMPSLHPCVCGGGDERKVAAQGEGQGGSETAPIMLDASVTQHLGQMSLVHTLSAPAYPMPTPRRNVLVTHTTNMVVAVNEIGENCKTPPELLQ